MNFLRKEIIFFFRGDIMPLPLFPIVGIALSSSLIALGVKVYNKGRKNQASLKQKTFAKYAEAHRVKEKTAKSLDELLVLKEQIRDTELHRFGEIFENILHTKLNWETETYHDPDYNPVISCAPASEVSALGGAAEWFKSAFVSLQSQLRENNLKLQDIVLKQGFDFEKYNYKDKAVVLQTYNLAERISRAMCIYLIDEKGNFRDASIDEVEDLVIETFENVA